MANGKKRGLRIAGKILWFLLSLVLLTVLGLVLIIGQPLNSGRCWIPFPHR